MEKSAYLLLIILFGCTSYKNNDNTLGTSHNIINIQEEQNNQNIYYQESPIQTRLLYYYTDPQSLAQSASSVSGNFYWQDGCIYLLSLDENRQLIKKTAMFPKLPKHEVIWNEKDKTITLTNRDNPPKAFIFNMGDYIRTNGRSTRRIPDNITLENMGDEQCLSKDGIAFIGTIGIEKLGGH